MDRVLNEHNQFEPSHVPKEQGMPIAELLTLETGKVATLRLELRDMKGNYDKVVKVYNLLVQKYEELTSKVLADADKSDPVDKDKKKEKKK